MERRQARLGTAATAEVWCGGAEPNKERARLLQHFGAHGHTDKAFVLAVGISAGTFVTLVVV